MYSAKSFQLTKDEFNYLLPVLKNKLHQSGDRCYFTANNIDDLRDILNRLKCTHFILPIYYIFIPNSAVYC